MTPGTDRSRPGGGGFSVEQADGAAASILPTTDNGRDAAPLVEVTRSGTQRHVESRTAYGACRICHVEWVDSFAPARAAEHARKHGHETAAAYSATYIYGRPVAS